MAWRVFVCARVVTNERRARVFVGSDDTRALPGVGAERCFRMLVDGQQPLQIIHDALVAKKLGAEVEVCWRARV